MREKERMSERERERENERERELKKKPKMSVFLACSIVLCGKGSNFLRPARWGHMAHL